MNDENKGLQVNQSTGEIVGVEAPLSAADIIERRNVIKKIMSQAMVDGAHYGQIPGTQGKALLKLGADMLMSVFHIAADPEVFDLSGPSEIRYRVLLRGRTMGSGMLVGVGVGECSSNEEKYRWKKANRREWDSTAENARRTKFYGNNEVLQVRQNPYDQANTVLKMAKKRASVDFALTALGAAEMFEDFDPPAPRDTNGHTPHQAGDQPPPMDDAPPYTEARQQDTAAQAEESAEPVREGYATGEQIHLVRKAADSAGFRDVDVFAQLGITGWNGIKPEQVEPALKWIEKNAP